MEDFMKKRIAIYTAFLCFGQFLFMLNALAQDETDATGNRQQGTETASSDKIFMLSLGTGMSPLEEPAGIVPGSVNTRLGFYVSQNILLDFGLDFTRAHASFENKKFSIEYLDESYNIFTLHVGAKFYFTQPNRAGKVVFYDQASFFMLIPFSTSESESVKDAINDTFTFGFLEGIGAEYFFADNFSIGGEFGLNFFFLTYNGDNVEGAVDLIDLYTGFTLNFFI